MTRHLVDHLAQSLAVPMTRRASIGIFAAALLSRNAASEEAAAKRKKKRRKKRKRRRGSGAGNDRCLRLAETCVAGAAQSCCDGLECEPSRAEGATGSACCQPERTACTGYETCCSGTCDFLVDGGSCAPCRGRTCSATLPCCGGESCVGGFCGGCRDRAVACTASSQCCFSDCTSGACLSAQGGTCARDVDCRACYLGGNCAGACVNGSCAV